MRDTRDIEKRVYIRVIISRLYILNYNRLSTRELFILLSLINLYNIKLRRRTRLINALLISIITIIKSEHERRFFLDLLLLLLILLFLFFFLRLFFSFSIIVLILLIL